MHATFSYTRINLPFTSFPPKDFLHSLQAAQSLVGLPALLSDAACEVGVGNSGKRMTVRCFCRSCDTRVYPQLGWLEQMLLVDNASD